MFIDDWKVFEVGFVVFLRLRTWSRLLMNIWLLTALKFCPVTLLCNAFFGFAESNFVLGPGFYSLRIKSIEPFGYLSYLG
jgi:hypothetical protein